MESKTIKISEENYRWLLKLASDAQKELGRPVSFEETLNNLRDKKMRKKNIMDFAGAWKMSDKEAKKLILDIYKERKVTSRRL